TWLVPPEQSSPNWYLRVHRIRGAAGRGLISADGGWAIYDRGPDDRAISGPPARVEDGPAARAVSSAGAVGIVALEDGSDRTGRVVDADSNSSVIFARSVIPTVVGEVKGDDVWYVTGVFGLPDEGGFCKIGEGKGPREGWETEWEKRPRVPEGILAEMKVKV
ncbi:hypothetical protein FRC08_014961, partial [Ceratobasidium sp. 394]